MNPRTRLQPQGELRRIFDIDHSPFLYLLPTLLFLLLFLAYPIAEVIRQSFFHNVAIRPHEGTPFVGLDNYRDLLTSERFYAALRVTVLWTILSVGGKMLVGFTGALILQERFSARRAYLTLLMVPWVTPIVVAAVVWRWVLNSQYGQLNALLNLLGIESVAWLGGSSTAFAMTAVADMWVGIPFVTLVLMAGLQSIPDELYEAARVDGAGSLAMLRHVTIPGVRHIMLVVALLSTVWTFNSFQVIWPLTRGGPARATTTLVIQTYRVSFGSFDFGRGAAYSVMIFIVLLAVSIGYWTAIKRGER